MTKHFIYDFYNNPLKKTFEKVDLLDQDTDFFIALLSDKGIIVYKMCDMHMTFDFSELDNPIYFYKPLVNHSQQEVDKNKLLSNSRSST